MFCKEQDTDHNISGVAEEDDSINFNALYVKKRTNTHWDDELNAYLQSPRVAGDTNILHWWKCHSNVYPTLSMMARDILSIMPTSVPSERVFSEGSLHVEKNICSLKDDSIRALLCINRWMRSSVRSFICNINL